KHELSNCLDPFTLQRTFTKFDKHPLAYSRVVVSRPSAEVLLYRAHRDDLPGARPRRHALRLRFERTSVPARARRSDATNLPARNTPPDSRPHQLPAFPAGFPPST